MWLAHFESLNLGYPILMFLGCCWINILMFLFLELGFLKNMTFRLLFTSDQHLSKFFLSETNGIDSGGRSWPFLSAQCPPSRRWEPIPPFVASHVAARVTELQKSIQLQKGWPIWHRPWSVSTSFDPRARYEADNFQLRRQEFGVRKLFDFRERKQVE